MAKKWQKWATKASCLIYTFYPHTARSMESSKLWLYQRAWSDTCKCTGGDALQCRVLIEWQRG
ncbi:hypothetical protein PanWU01x14_251320, partial [Parasponia andersonii]